MTTPTTLCIDEPISWLRLERYRLGELDAAERARIDAHLASCPACAASLESIERDDEVALLPLPSRPVASLSGARGRLRSRAPQYGAVIAGGLALAAAVALTVGDGWRSAGVEPRGGGTRVKGDAVLFSLVRDDDSRIDDATGSFREGDRFKAVVTCPPSMEATFDLVVYDADGGASFPVPPARLVCGNGVPMPGAFRLTGGGEETVCVVWGAGADSDARSALATGAPAERSLCKRLTSGGAQ